MHLYRLITISLVGILVSLGILGNNNIAYAQQYPDVQESDWFHPYITDLTEEEIFTGFPDGRFGPWEPINRAEVAKVISNLKESLRAERDEGTFFQKHLFELLLIIVTLFGWSFIYGAIKSMSNRPIVIRDEKGNYNSSTKQENNSPLMQRMIAKDNENNKRERNHESNWWL